MKLIILAAGRGERLMPLTRNTPKPLLDLGTGSTLLEEQLSAVHRSGAVSEVIVVLGYLADQVEAKIKTHPTPGLRVRAVYNPFYAVSNNLMSLWLARHEMDTDFMVTNGDNLFHDTVFAGMAEACRAGVHLAVGEKSEFDGDDMKVVVQDGEIVEVSKAPSRDNPTAESPGLSLVRGERHRALFSTHLERLARRPEYVGRFWLEVFNSMADGGIPVRPWYFDAAQHWREVDFHGDVGRLGALLAGYGELARGRDGVGELVAR